MSKPTRSQISSGQDVEVVIDEYGPEGRGRVRLSDGWLEVPQAIPGERVVVRPRGDERDDTGRRIIADVIDVLEESEERRDPLCERDEVCEGCQMRHLTVAAELEWKVQTIRGAIEEYAGIEKDSQPDIGVVTPQPIARGDAFRIRCRLSYRRDGENFQLGLVSPIEDELIPMSDCPAQTAPMQRLIASIEASLAEGEGLPPDLPGGGRQEESNAAVDRPAKPGLKAIRVVSPTHGVGLIEVLLSEFDDQNTFESVIYGDVYGPWLQRLVDEVPQQVGVAATGGSFREYLAEPRRIRIPIGKWEMEVGYDDWFHTTLKPAYCVYEQMMQWLNLDGTDRVVDIGCGTGTITLMTAEEADEVVGLDVNPSSIEAAEINAAGHGQTNVEFVTAGWQRGLRQLAMDGEDFSVATINPMRQPVGRRTLAFLEVLQVERLVYLGPSPKAAARDIGELVDLGWSLTKLSAANLYPATHHTLLMAAMRR